MAESPVLVGEGMGLSQLQFLAWLLQIDSVKRDAVIAVCHLMLLCCLGTPSKWKRNSFCALSKLLRKLLWICVTPVEPKPVLSISMQGKLCRAMHS